MWSSLSEIWQEESDPLTGSRQLFPGAHYHPLFSQRAVGVEVCRVASTSGARIPRYCHAIRSLWRIVLSLFGGGLSISSYRHFWFTRSSKPLSIRKVVKE